MSKRNMRRAILALALIAVAELVIAVAVSMIGCVNPARQSQRTVVEAGRGLAEVDTFVSSRIEYAGEAARERMRQRAETECTEANREECSLAIYRELMDPWNQAVEALERTQSILQAWESLNDAWSETGQKPDDFNARICQPLGETLNIVVRLFIQIGVELPSEIESTIDAFPGICGVIVTAAQDSVQ